MRHGGLDQVEHGPNVELEGVIPLLLGDLVERLVRHLESGVADEDIDLAELLDCILDDIPAVLCISKIATH